MIVILHGEDLASSRNTLLKLSSKIPTPRTELSISDVTPHQLAEYLGSFDIFNGAPFIVLDISKAGRANLETYLEVIQTMSIEANLVLLSDKSLSKSNIFIKNAAKLKAKVVGSALNYDSNIFKFVDAVFNGNRTQSYTELKSLLLEDKDPFYIFSMLLYGLRTITNAFFDTSAFKKASPYVKSKSQSQSKKFTQETLQALYTDMYELDLGVKTGLFTSDLLIPLAVEKILYYTQNTN